MSERKRYTVWVSQSFGTAIEIIAEDEASAIAEALEQYDPYNGDMEEDGEADASVVESAPVDAEE